MNLNNLSPQKKSYKISKRVGRGIGSGWGKTCSRGHKGQKSRTGGKIRRGFEGGQMPLYRRLPKFGFISAKKLVKQEVRLSILSQITNNIIDLNTLKQSNIIGQNIKYVKIILSGKINRSITIKGITVTKNVRLAIENSGGKIEE